MSIVDLLVYEVVCEIRTASGRVYTYEPLEFLRQVQSKHTDAQIDVLVDRCLREKQKFCKWDQENTNKVIDSENFLRASLRKLFFQMREGLLEEEQNPRRKPSAISGKGWTIPIRFNEE